MGLFPVAAMGKQERRNSGRRPWEMTEKKFGRYCWAGQPRKMRKQRGASASMGKKGSWLGGKRVGRYREGPAAPHPSKASNSRGAMGGEEPSSLLQPLARGRKKGAAGLCEKFWAPWRNAGRASGPRRPWLLASCAPAMERKEWRWAEIRPEVEEGLGRHPWERLEERDAMAASLAPCLLLAAVGAREEETCWLKEERVAARGVDE
jgi:hypothetical protein